METVQFLLSVGSVFVAFWVFFGSLGAETSGDKDAPSGSGFESVAYLLLIPFFVLAALGVACWKIFEWLRDGTEALWESTEEQRERMTHTVRERLIRTDGPAMRRQPTRTRRMFLRQRQKRTGDEEEQQEEAGFSDEEEELLAVQRMRRVLAAVAQSTRRMQTRIRSNWHHRTERMRRWFERRMDQNQDGDARTAHSNARTHDHADLAPPMPKRVRLSRRMRLHDDADDSEESLTVLRPIGWHTRRRLRHVA